MNVWKQTLTSFVLLLPICLQAQSSSFDADSAYAYTEHLSVNIGPRPMGSRNEIAALQWATEKLNSFGADTAYVLRLTEATVGRNLVNTQSGTAVGVFKGETDSTIVVGGHIDSSAPEHPGANDDATGTACVLELARKWSQEPRHYTLVFVAFGGEESGLVASRHFANHYAGIDEVALMLQIDMAGSTDPLIMFLESGHKQTPEWLVKDAYAVERTAGYESLSYPMFFFSINNTAGGAGSDHAPFIDRGIPAIDFTTGINTSPIHTQQDKIAFIDKAGLARSGNIVDGLLRKYQAHGIPAETTGNYMLWPMWGGRFYIPAWAIVSVVILALAVGAWAFAASRNRRLQIPKAERVRFSGIKLLLMMIVIAICTQLGEAGMQTLKGLRYPWLAHIDKYLWFAAIWAGAGAWLALQLTKTWQFSSDPYVYAKRALSILIVFVAALFLASARLALFPALTLLCVGLAVFVPSRIFKLVMAILAPIPMFKLMFMEAFPFLAQNLSMIGLNIHSFFPALLYSGAITVALVVWYLPILNFYALLRTEIKPAGALLAAARKPVFGGILILAIIGYGGYLYSFPAYSDKWRAALRIDAHYDTQTGDSKLELRGNEYFKNVVVKSDSLERKYDGSVSQDSLAIPFAANWVHVSGSESLRTGEPGTVDLDWLITTDRNWLQAKVVIKADTAGIDDAASELAFSLKDETLAFRWLWQPPDSLRLRAKLNIEPGARLIREVTAVYGEMPIPISVQTEFASVRYRTTVVVRDTLEVARILSTQK